MRVHRGFCRKRACRRVDLGAGDSVILDKLTLFFLSKIIYIPHTFSFGRVSKYADNHYPRHRLLYEQLPFTESSSPRPGSALVGLSMSIV
jgi:hypothetical protein